MNRWLQLIVLLGWLAQPGTSLVVRTPKTWENFIQFCKQQTSGKAVESGGWYKLEKEATLELGKANLGKVRDFLPKSYDVVEGGGYFQLQSLAADPKGILTKLIVEGLTKKGTKGISASTLDTLVALLQAEGKGYDSKLVDGEWISVLSRQGSGSPKLQQLVAKSEKAGKAYANFSVRDLTFSGGTKVLRGLGELTTKVEYMPVAEAFDSKGPDNKKIILRRITCQIVEVKWKFWKLPRIALPLRRITGYLDFLYLDNDMRITRGNQGGVFVHFRPEYLNQALQEV